MSAFYSQVARFYDAETGDKTDDLIMYSRLAEESSGGILDVGCGTGRVMIHLAQQGHHVHGIDNDRAMLERFAQKIDQLPSLRGQLSIIHADALTHPWTREFSLILLSYHVLMQFHEQEEQITLLENLRRCLAPQGMLVIDLPNAGPAFASEDTDALTFERSFIDPQTGHLIMLQTISFLDRATQILSIDWFYDEIDGDGVVRRLIAPHRLRYFFRSEIQLLLERCGYALSAVCGDTDGAPYEAESERMIVYATAV